MSAARFQRLSGGSRRNPATASRCHRFRAAAGVLRREPVFHLAPHQRGLQRRLREDDAPEIAVLSPFKQKRLVWAYCGDAASTAPSARRTRSLRLLSGGGLARSKRGMPRRQGVRRRRLPDDRLGRSRRPFDGHGHRVDLALAARATPHRRGDCGPARSAPGRASRPFAGGSRGGH